MRGFTLIELIVVVAIVTIVSVGVSVNYFSFNSRQKLRSESKDLLALIDKTRTRATVLEYPSGCTALTTYALRSLPVLGRFEVVANCATGSFVVESSDILVATETESAVSISFLPQTGQVVGGGDVTIKIIDKNDPKLSVTLLVDAYVINKSRVVE